MISKIHKLMLASLAVMAGGIGLVSVPFTRADAPTGTTSADPATTTLTAIAITRPSKESKLAFAGAGLVSDITVKDGDFVKLGQILASQDMREDQFAYQSMKLEADSNEKIDYSKADRALKETQLTRKEEMLKEHVASQSEVEEAQNAVDLASAQIALAVLEHQQKNFDAQKQAVKLEQMQIHAPYDGIVEKVIINPGEMADPQSRDGAIVVAQWDPLWVEMHLPSSQAAQLKLGQTLEAKYDGGDWQSAKVIFFEHVDAASDTQLVRMEMPNPANAQTGGASYSGEVTGKKSSRPRRMEDKRHLKSRRWHRREIVTGFLQ